MHLVLWFKTFTEIVKPVIVMLPDGTILRYFYELKLHKNCTACTSLLAVISLYCYRVFRKFRRHILFYTLLEAIPSLNLGAEGLMRACTGVRGGGLKRESST
jgi:hypothetical protein